MLTKKPDWNTHQHGLRYRNPGGVFGNWPELSRFEDAEHCVGCQVAHVVGGCAGFMKTLNIFVGIIS